MCVGLPHCHPVIPEERPGHSLGHRHCGKPRKLLLLFWFVKATPDRLPCQRLCSTRVAHAGVNLHSRGKPGMNHQVNRWDPAAFLMCCRDQRGEHFQPCKFLMAKFSLEMLVSMFAHALLWVPGSGVLPALGSDGCSAAIPSHSPALLSPCWSWLCSAEGGAGSDPQGDKGSLCSPDPCSLLPQCLCTLGDELQLLFGVYSCVGTEQSLRHWQNTTSVLPGA